jgi:hypothetical protein
MGSVVTVLRERIASVLGLTHQGARDLYSQFGYPRDLVVEQLFAMYYRNGIANRIIKAFPAATWRDPPLLCDEDGSSAEEGTDDFSPFTKAADSLFKKYNVLAYCERADRLASVGRFGVLVMGFRDGLPLDKPLSRGNYPLLYFAVYGEPSITISEWDNDETSPRFGRPTMYTLQTAGPVISGQRQVVRKSIRVHWSRVVHITEFPEEDDIYGLPRLLPIFNHLIDLEKIMGAGSEVYWLNARGGMALSADKDANITDEALADMRSQVDQFEHQLRRTLALQGVTAQMLQATVQDPSMMTDKLLDVIAGSVGIPKRILLGTERGELSSDQDENNWAQRIEERRKNFAIPYILQQVVARLIETGNLKPNGEWHVDWPGEALSPDKAANVGLTRSNTLRNYVTSPGAELIVPPGEFRKVFLGLDPESKFEEVEELEPLPDEDVPDEDVPDESEEPVSLTSAQLHTLKARGGSFVKPLYIRRNVVNAEDIVEWAKEQGFSSIIREDELHVTVCYSRTPIDWFKLNNSWNEDENGQLTIKAGGPRSVEEFGEGAIVLRFASPDLTYRHEEVVRLGGSHDYGASYAPHITITYNRDDLDLEDVVPYRGKIILGPEIFEEIKKAETHEIDLL